MQVFYADRFVLPLPEGHRFPMSKYATLRRRVESSEVSESVELREPPAVTDDDLLRVHTADYVRRACRGELSPDEIRRIGFPWSPELIERSRRSAGATLAAARAAMRQGVAVSLAGGTHHAFADRGEGYCVFNDSVIAARALQAERLVKRVLVLDCDVHQGNGTAALCRDDPSIFTFSIHGSKNFPFKKEQSDIDIALDDGTTDVEYLAALETGIEEAIQRSRPQLVLFLAGADPWRGDRWGRLALSKQGLRRRDRRVFESCKARNLPLVVTMAGGYAPRVEDIVDIHFSTVESAAIHHREVAA